MRSILILFSLVALLVGCDASADMNAKTVDEILRRELQVGDSQQKIEAILSKAKIEYSFDEFNQRYQCIIRDPSASKPKGYHSIVVHVYVNSERRYLKHEARDSYTAL
jgi:hypothetical protein